MERLRKLMPSRKASVSHEPNPGVIDVSVEALRARRVASEAKNSYLPKYRVEEELVVKAAQYQTFTINGTDTLLAPVVIQAGRYGGDWHVDAILSEPDKGPGEPATVLGSMWCSPGTSRDEALEVADDWVRNSSLWVPHREEIPVPDQNYRQYFGAAYYLLRAN